VDATGSLFAAELRLGAHGVPQLWSQADGFFDIPFYGPDLDAGSANAITPDGAIVVGEMHNSANSRGAAFRWTAATGTVSLGWLPPVVASSVSAAADISADGLVVVGDSSGVGVPRRAFRWTQAAGMQDIGLPATGSSAWANAVNADGSVIVGAYTIANTRHAMVWSAPDGARDLQQLLMQHGSSGEIAYWTLQEATGVSDDGRTAVGFGIDPQGRTQAFLARIPTEPCYANCDQSTAYPALNVLDFNCFLNRFTAGDTYSNCDGSTEPPVLNVLDFNCFINRFTLGC
jgi:probable HAF family extracellular repeat protein